MTHSPEINHLAEALAKAQGQMKPAIKDATNPHYRSKYADLAANVEAARGPLAANGLAVVQEAVTVEKGIAVSTRLLHASGQWLQFDPLTVPLSKMDAHGVGSATSYARRYALGAALGLVAEDDDGNAAVVVYNHHDPPKQTAVPKAPEGYGAWCQTIAAAAELGIKKLEEAWAKGTPEYRKFMVEHTPDVWEAYKKTAASKRDVA